MSSAFSDHVEYTIIQGMFGGASMTSLTAPAGGVWVGLHVSAPTDTGVGSTEPSSTAAYTRIQVATDGWTYATAGTMTAKNNASITFPTNTGTAYTVTHISINNHSSATDATALWYWGAASASVTVNASDAYVFSASALIITLS